MQRMYPEIGALIPQIWLPTPQVDLTRWAVIACDQFTAQPAYWRQVEAWVGDAPSTFHLVLPEIYLDDPSCGERIEKIHQQMADYLAKGLLQPYHGMVYVERMVSGGHIRRGLMLALDLEQYDYRPGSAGLIRASEATILERLQPRLEVRRGAILEVPHTMVLIDDREGNVHHFARQACRHLKPLYEVELPFGGGHCSGWLVNQPEVESRILQALRTLACPERYAERYNLEAAPRVMLYAVGDGNHSFAAAKAHWDQLKRQPGVSADHPARYALVELVNLHDEALCFEPIHRVIFNIRTDLAQALHACYGGRVRITACQGEDPLRKMVSIVDGGVGAYHHFGIMTADGIFVVEVMHSKSNLPVGTLQSCLDSLVKDGKVSRIDYVHGVEVAYQLGVQPGNAGFYLPPMPKEELFHTVILDGALPHKTFSIGKARDKRYYIESRKIMP